MIIGNIWTYVLEKCASLFCYILKNQSSQTLYFNDLVVTIGILIS